MMWSLIEEIILIAMLASLLVPLTMYVLHKIGLFP
jgi:hypothetical protein